MSVSLMFTSAEESLSTYGIPPPGPWFSTCWSGSAGTGPQSQWWKHTKTSEEKSVVAFIDGTFRRVNGSPVGSKQLEYTANVPVVDEDQRRHQQVRMQTHFGRRDKERRSKMSLAETKKSIWQNMLESLVLILRQVWQWEGDLGLLIYWNNWRWGAGCGCSGMMRRCVWEVNGKFYSSRK